MDLSVFGVRAGAGSLRGADEAGLVLEHAWTEAGVVAGPATNGAQVLHLSVALCVLNDTYREAARLGIRLGGVCVRADGGFDEDWRSTGVRYEVTLDSSAPPEEQARLLDVVDAVAEVPRALRRAATVTRVATVAT